MALKAPVIEKKLTKDEVLKKLLDIYKVKGKITEGDLQSALFKSEISEDDYMEILSLLNSKGALDESSPEEKLIEDEKKEEEVEDADVEKPVQPHYERQFEESNKEQSSLNMYFAEIGRYPLLSKEEEIELSKKIMKGDTDAEETLTNCNLRLVASIANKYRRLGTSLAYQDLISYGNQGLMTAVKKYDYRKGCRFSTYASFWIKQSISRSIALYGHEIKIPVYVATNLQKIKSIQSALTLKLNREPTFEEIAKEAGTTAQKVEETLSYDNNVVSLDKPTKKDEDNSLEQFQADESTSPDFNSYKDEDISYALNCLTDREKKLVIYRFGLFDESPHTLEEVGKIDGITRERARQIISEALKKMKKALSGNNN